MPIFFILNPLPTQNSLPGDAAAKETAPNNSNCSTKLFKPTLNRAKRRTEIRRAEKPIFDFDVGRIV